MSHTILKDGYVVAKKDYISQYRDNFDYLVTKDENGKIIVDLKEAKSLYFTDDEIKTLQLAIDNEWKISKGEHHHCQTGIYDGEFYTARAPKGIHEICCKHQLFEEY